MDRDGWRAMAGERMRQGTERARTQRRVAAVERERREDAAEREGEPESAREGEWGREGERLGRATRGVPAGLTEWERLAVIQALEGLARLVAEQVERGLGEGRAGRWLMDEVRAWAVTMAAAMDGAAAGQLAAEEGVAPARRDGVLTRRELEVLGLAARGMKGPEIARALALSLETVHTHQARTRAKLGVSGTAAAVAKARVLGLI